MCFFIPFSAEHRKMELKKSFFLIGNGTQQLRKKMNRFAGVFVNGMTAAILVKRFHQQNLSLKLNESIKRNRGPLKMSGENMETNGHSRPFISYLKSTLGISPNKKNEGFKACC